MSQVTVRIENYYPDGHESTFLLEVPGPTSADVEEWWWEVVFPYTGDGHGIGGMDAVYVATVTDADAGDLVGQTREWS